MTLLQEFFIFLDYTYATEELQIKAQVYFGVLYLKINRCVE